MRTRCLCSSWGCGHFPGQRGEGIPPLLRRERPGGIPSSPRLTANRANDQAATATRRIPGGREQRLQQQLASSRTTREDQSLAAKSTSSARTRRSRPGGAATPARKNLEVLNGRARSSTRPATARCSA